MAEPQTISGDTQFAEIVIREGYASQVQVQECLRIQADLTDKGTPRQLGAIMVERGYLTIQQVEEILDKLSKRTLECASCGGRFTVRGYEAGQHYTCPRCGNLLDSPAEGSEDVQPIGEVGGGIKLDPENLVNHTVGGCKVLEKLAIGGMGTIYKARQLSMNRLVVVKTLSEDLAKDKAYVQRFLQEARAAGELSHTNLIHVMDVGYQDGVFYYIMEFIDGINLDTILAQKGRIPVDQGIDIIIQTARALDQAHQRNIIHRDIKPDNIMITRDGVVKLADLGIAKKISSDMGVTEPGMVLGTPFYMAPEQGRDSRSVDHRSDIYGLGATFYHMLSGNVPFDGKTTLEIVMKSIEEEPPPLKETDATLPDEVVAIIERMMKKRPEERYQSMGEVISDLDRVKAHKPLEWMARKPVRQVTPDPVPAVPPRPKSGGTKKHADPPPQRHVTPPVEESDLVVPSRTPTPAPASKPVKLSAAKRRELGLDDSDLDVKPGAPAPAAPVKPSVPSRPLPQRAAPQPGTGKVAGILADSQGATPGKIYKERQRDLVWPILTVLGVLISVFVAFKLLRGAGKEQNTNAGGGGIIAQPGSGSTGDNPGAYDNPHAQKALKEANAFAEQFPTNLRDQATKYKEVSDGFPGTQSGSAALKLYEEVVKKRDEQLKGEYEEVQTKIDMAKVSKQFGEALLGIEDFERKDISETWKKKVAGDRDELLKMGKEVYEKAILESDELYGGGDLWGAIERLDKERNIGIENYAGMIDLRLSKYETEGYEAQDAGMVEYRKARDNDKHPIKPMSELINKLKLEEAKKRLQDIGQEPEVKDVRREIERDIADIDTALAVIQSAREGVQSLKNQVFTFVQRRGDGGPMGERKETVASIDKDTINTVVDGKERSINLLGLMYTNLAELALKVLPPEQADTPQRVGVFFLVVGLIDEAEQKFLQAESMGADVAEYLTKIEDIRIRDRVPAEPRILYYSPKGERWDARGGTWHEQQDLGYVAGGEVKGDFEYTPPGERWDEYIFKGRAKKVRGLNGFEFCFRALGKDMRWKLGDDGGKKCWIEGVDSTTRTIEIETGRWYSVKLVVTKQWMVAYVNNKRQWRVSPTDVRLATPSGLTSGWGLGVAGTKVYFRDVKIWPLQ